MEARERDNAAKTLRIAKGAKVCDAFSFFEGLLAHANGSVRRETLPAVKTTVDCWVRALLSFLSPAL